jgi:hypothetical protein
VGQSLTPGNPPVRRQLQRVENRSTAVIPAVPLGVIYSPQRISYRLIEQFFCTAPANNRPLPRLTCGLAKFYNRAGIAGNRR